MRSEKQATISPLYELRGSSFKFLHSSPNGPMPVTSVTYSPDFAQWKCQVSPGRTITAPGGYAFTLSPSNFSPRPM